MRVNPLYLSFFWAVPLFVLATGRWKKRLIMERDGGAGHAYHVSPIVIRNYVFFPEFTADGGHAWRNLWEGW